MQLQIRYFDGECRCKKLKFLDLKSNEHGQQTSTAREECTPFTKRIRNPITLHRREVLGLFDFDMKRPFRPFALLLQSARIWRYEFQPDDDFTFVAERIFERLGLKPEKNQKRSKIQHKRNLRQSNSPVLGEDTTAEWCHRTLYFPKAS